MATSYLFFAPILITTGSNKFVIYEQTTGTQIGVAFGSGIVLTGGTSVENTFSIGLSGGQTVYGGTQAGENLSLTSTSNATKGKINLGASGVDYISEVNHHLTLFTTSGITTTGSIWNDLTRKMYSIYANGMQHNLVGTIFTQTADKTVTNTITETSIVGTGVGTLTLPANFFVAGKTIRITMAGVYSTVAVTGDTVTVKVKKGSTVLVSKATTALVTGGTNLAWEAEVLITCRSTGASGTVQVGGGLTYQVAGAVAVYDELNNGVATSTLDTTTSGLLDITVTHSAANASNTVKSLVSAFEVVN